MLSKCSEIRELLLQETQQHINDIIGNDVSKTARITSDEQNEVLEAEPKPSNQSKVNFSSELNETSFLRTEDELIKGLQVRYFSSINMNFKP